MCPNLNKTGKTYIMLYEYDNEQKAVSKIHV